MGQVKDPFDIPGMINHWQEILDSPYKIEKICFPNGPDVRVYTDEYTRAFIQDKIDWLKKQQAMQK